MAAEPEIIAAALGNTFKAQQASSKTSIEVARDIAAKKGFSLEDPEGLLFFFAAAASDHWRWDSKTLMPIINSLGKQFPDVLRALNEHLNRVPRQK